MWFLAYFILGLLVLAASAFACWPILRYEHGKGRLLQAGALATLVIGIGGGAYLVLGHPYLAARSLTDVTARDYSGAVAALARMMSKNPKARADPRGWLMLARGYESLGDRADASAAFRQAIVLMVARLQAQLKTQPNDPAGWQRLIRSYVTLGQEDNAHTAMADARRALASDRAAQAALDAEAKELRLDK